eukprot:152458_1
MTQFVCKFCQKSFISQGMLDRHKCIYSNEHKSVQTHQQQDHNTDERTFDCHTCRKSFKTPSELTEHRRSHSVERQFECNSCGNSFIPRRNPVIRRYTHYDDKLHLQCESCEKSHNDEMRFTCS